MKIPRLFCRPQSNARTRTEALAASWNSRGRIKSDGTQRKRSRPGRPNRLDRAWTVHPGTLGSRRREDDSDGRAVDRPPAPRRPAGRPITCERWWRWAARRAARSPARRRRRHGGVTAGAADPGSGRAGFRNARRRQRPSLRARDCAVSRSFSDGRAARARAMHVRRNNERGQPAWGGGSGGRAGGTARRIAGRRVRIVREGRQADVRGREAEGT